MKTTKKNINILSVFLTLDVYWEVVNRIPKKDYTPSIVGQSGVGGE